MHRQKARVLAISCMILAGLCSTLVEAVQRQPAVMTTLAGTGKAGFAGDGGPARAALLNQPFHCDVDNKGSLYVAEAFNHCIRKVDLKSGKISTVAGAGKKGFSGDGGPATQAAFNEPYAVVVNEAGDLFIVDRLNAVVRKVDGRTGVVSTLAGTGKKGYSGDGGPADKAMLTEPNDCILDGKGGLLIADVGDWRVRRVDLQTGTISTFAGTGRPKVKGKIDRTKIGDGGPARNAITVGARAVCIDGKGNTYICEREGSSIRKVDAAGVITTIAGTGARGCKGDGGPAAEAVFDAPKGIRCDAAGNIYVVDTENHCIRKIAVPSPLSPLPAGERGRGEGIVSTIAGGRKGGGGDNGPATQAGMDRPHGCVVDAHGNLYIADSNNHRVRLVSAPE